MTFSTRWFIGVVLLTALVSSAPAQSVTIGGIVRDTVSLAGLDAVRIDIVSTLNPAEHYSVATNTAGQWSYTFPAAGVEREGGIPQTFGLQQNYPNPFNPSTLIPFSLRKAGTVTLVVHNILGQRLDARTMTLAAGEYSVRWTSKGAAGALFYTLHMDGMSVTKKMIQLDGARGTGGGLGIPALTGGVSSTPLPAKVAAPEYRIIASKLGYEPDSAVAPFVSSTSFSFNLSTVHRRAFVFDLHNDILELEASTNGYDMGVRHTTNQSDIPRFKDGGIDAQMISLWPDPGSDPAGDYHRVIVLADTFEAQVARNAADVALVRTVEGIQAANNAGKIAFVYGVEGGTAIENDLNKLITFYRRGARYLTITWNRSTDWAVAASDARSTTVGLSDFGRQVIRTMDSLGMLVDVSHTGVKTVDDILQTTTNPIIASHSGAYALRAHTRNLTDSQIRAIAQRGGVIGVVFYTAFISSSSASKVTIDTVVKHIDYIKNLVGVDYVAIGSDFDGGITTPVGLETVAKMPNLTMALLQRGYSIADVKKILGGNYLRVFKAVCR